MTTHFPGSRLASAILSKAAELNLSKKDLAIRFGISYPYFASLLSGSRLFCGMGYANLRRIAAFLGLTFVQVCALAEIIEPADFFPADTFARDLECAYQTMLIDPVWNNVAPTREEWDALTQKTQLGIALLYQSTTQQALLTRASMIQFSTEPDLAAA